MDSDLVNAKMTVETSDGVIYTFPKVKLTVTPNVQPGEMYGDPHYFYEQGPASVKSMKIEGYAFPGGEINCIMTVTKEMKKVATCKVPELYEDDLIKITKAMGVLDDLAMTGVFSCEIRVKTDDVDTWVVIGFGEDCEPAILRFEND